MKAEFKSSVHPVSSRCCVRKLSGTEMLREQCWDFPRPEARLGEQQRAGGASRGEGGRLVGRERCPFTPALPLLLQGSLPCDPALTLPTRQPSPGPLPRTRCPGQALSGEDGEGSRACSPPRRVVLGSLPGAHCQPGSLGTDLWQGGRHREPIPALSVPQRSSQPSLPCPAAGDLPALPIEGITLIHREGLTRVSTGDAGLAATISNVHGLGSVN